MGFDQYDKKDMYSFYACGESESALVWLVLSITQQSLSLYDHVLCLSGLTETQRWLVKFSNCIYIQI